MAELFLKYDTATGRKIAKEETLGGGSSGINYIDNPDAETDTTGWATYVDAAGTIPVDGTGGSANVTLTRTTSTPLRGTGSFLLTKDAANRQGEGASYDFTVDNADKNKTLSINLDIEGSANFPISGVGVFIYDVTNAVLLTPFNSSIEQASGTLKLTFTTSDSTSYRLILHVAETGTAAWTLKFDNVKVGPEEVVYGSIVTEWQSYTPTFTGFGSETLRYARYRRVGDSIELQIGWETGTPSATLAKVSLPTGLDVDVSYDPTRIGTWQREGNASEGLAVLTDASDTNAVFFGSTEINTNVNSLTVQNGNFITGTSSKMVLNAVVKVASWSSNIALANATQFKISSVLVNGTRVTSTPSKLGEYRTYTKFSSSTTAADNAPSAAYEPSNANGMRIQSRDYSTAGTSGQPNRWEIFIGKNKNYEFEAYLNAGRTGLLDTTLVEGIADGGTRAIYGLHKSYDPSTGVLLVDATQMFNNASQNDFRGVGFTGALNGGAMDEASAATEAYFDVLVSEKAQPQGLEAPNSEVVLHTGNGFGSTDTRIRRYSVVETYTGTAMTFTDTAANGTVITINEDGIYGMSMSDRRSGGTGGNFGFSRNSTQLTSNIDTINASDRLRHTTNPNGEHAAVATQRILRKGDLIRPHCHSTVDDTTAETGFNIIQLVKF